MMLAARGAIRASGAGLPYDAEVEYLESSGTQYIDTGIVPTTTKTEITFSTPTPPSSGYMCGSFNANNNRYYPVLFSGWSTRYINLANAANTVISQHTNDGNVHTVVYNATGGACYFDGVAAGALDTTALTASNPIYLFCTSTSTGASGLVSGRIYSCKLYDANGILVRDFIPVRKKTVGYLYDRVSGKLFGNAGTGDFVLGPDVVPVEWLEGTGTQYIDTGVGYFADFEISVKMRASLSNITLQAGSTNRLERISSADPCWRFRSTDGGAYDSSVPITELHTVAWRGGKIYSDGVEIVSHVKNFPTQETTVFGSSASQFPSMVYALNLWDSSNALVRKFRPVRVGTEGAMMDVLTRRIYRNAGTGAFSYGNDLKYPIPA